MEDGTMSTIHIDVPTNPDLSGHTAWPLVSGAEYHCKLGKFPVEALLTSQGGTSGSFSISGVPGAYDIVTFTGTFDDKKPTQKGLGQVAWTGSHISVAAGDGGWTSEITTPVPVYEETHAHAKGQTS
jgi:hypothetical protein